MIVYFLIQFSMYKIIYGGAKRDRTADLLRARQALSQLSYGPILICDTDSNVDNGGP